MQSLRVDEDENLRVGRGMGAERDGVAAFDPGGVPLGLIELPERSANPCFGGLHRHQLFTCGSTSLQALSAGTRGAALR